jgi:hypothetical protein
MTDRDPDQTTIVVDSGQPATTLYLPTADGTIVQIRHASTGRSDSERR